jgi:hypothetical protein
MREIGTDELQLNDSLTEKSKGEWSAEEAQAMTGIGSPRDNKLDTDDSDATAKAVSGKKPTDLLTKTVTITQLILAKPTPTATTASSIAAAATAAQTMASGTSAAQQTDKTAQQPLRPGVLKEDTLAPSTRTGTGETPPSLTGTGRLRLRQHLLLRRRLHLRRWLHQLLRRRVHQLNWPLRQKQQAKKKYRNNKGTSPP